MPRKNYGSVCSPNTGILCEPDNSPWPKEKMILSLYPHRRAKEKKIAHWLFVHACWELSSDANEGDEVVTNGKGEELRFALCYSVTIRAISLSRGFTRISESELLTDGSCSECCKRFSRNVIVSIEGDLPTAWSVYSLKVVDAIR